MRKFSVMFGLTLLVATTALPALVAQTSGVVLEMEIKDHTSSEPAQKVSASIAGKNLRMAIRSGPDRSSDVIFRGERREMLMVDHGSKSYVVMDEATIKSLVGQLDSAMAQMEEMLKNVPPEQRAMVEQMMRGRGIGAPAAAPARPATELRRTSERATHSGFPSLKYEVLRDGRVIREFWVTEWRNIEGGEEARAAFEQMAVLMNDLMNALSQSSIGAMVTIDEPMFEYMKDMAGFPVVTREFSASGTLEEETTLTSATRKAIEASAFEPPAGYTRQSMTGR